MLSKDGLHNVSKDFLGALPQQSENDGLAGEPGKPQSFRALWADTRESWHGFHLLELLGSLTSSRSLSGYLRSCWSDCFQSQLHFCVRHF
jgi:hypothetical protein